jgi:hypothetical protein
MVIILTAENAEFAEENKFLTLCGLSDLCGG